MHGHISKNGGKSKLNTKGPTHMYNLCKSAANIMNILYQGESEITGQNKLVEKCPFPFTYILFVFLS